jgi:hypothetical protein
MSPTPTSKSFRSGPPLQGEDREIRSDDAKDGEEDWTLHFMRGIADDLHQSAVFIDMRLNVAQDILDDHDGAVDQARTLLGPHWQRHSERLGGGRPGACVVGAAHQCNRRRAVAHSRLL